MSWTFASKKELTHKWESIRGKNKIIYFVYISNEIFELLCQHIVYDTIRLTLNPFGLVVIIINTRCMFTLFTFLNMYVIFKIHDININNFHFDLFIQKYLL